MNERDVADQLFHPFGSRLLLAAVESYDVLLGDDGNEVLDQQGNTIPTGLLGITFLEKGGSRSKVPFVLPMTGNTSFVGGLPELQSICVVGFKFNNDPIIIGFIPPSVHGLVASRRTVPNLQPGEVFLQASVRDVDVNASENFFRGARVWLDRYGRVRIEAQDYEFIVGFILSDEFTPNVSRLLDPVTNNPIFLREKIAGGVERRVDDQGNAMFSVLRDAHTQVGGNKKTTVTGTDTRTSKRGFLHEDGRGNSIGINEDGVLNISAGAGTYSMFSLGNSDESHGANKTVMVGIDLNTAITDKEKRLIGGTRNTTVGGVVGGVGDKTTVVSGDYEDHVTTGKRLLKALTGITLETTLLAPVKLGSDTASNPVPLGNELVDLWDQFLTALSLDIRIGNLGSPVTPSASLLSAITSLKTTFLTSPITNIVSQKVFLDRL